MTRRRTTAVLAGAALAGVLGTSASCLLYQGGTYAYFTDSATVKIRISTSGRTPSGSDQSDKRRGSKDGKSHEDPKDPTNPKGNGHTPAATAPPTTYPGKGHGAQPTPQPPGPQAPSTATPDAEPSATAADSGHHGSQRTTGPAAGNADPAPHPTAAPKPEPTATATPEPTPTTDARTDNRNGNGCQVTQKEYGTQADKKDQADEKGDKACSDDGTRDAGRTTGIGDSDS